MEEIHLETISWEIPEYKHIERSIDWIWGAGIIILLCAIISAVLGNYMFAVFILVGGSSIVLFNVRSPRTILIQIKTEGFSIGNETHEWKKIKGFRIKKRNDGKLLLIQTAERFLPIRSIPAPEELSEKIKESLKKVIPTIDDLDESPMVVFMEKLGL